MLSFRAANRIGTVLQSAIYEAYALALSPSPFTPFGSLSPLREPGAEQALPQAYRAALICFSKRLFGQIGSCPEFRHEDLVVIAAPVSK